MDSRRYYNNYEEDERRWNEKRNDGRYGYDTNGSVAYDFSLFEGRTVNYTGRTRTQKKKEESKQNKPKNASGSRSAAKSQSTGKSVSKANSIDRTALARFVALGIICAVAVGALLSCRMEYHEIMQEISAANSELAGLQQEYVDLSVSFESKMSNSAIEDYATDVLGMQKRDRSQTEYVTLGGGDVFECTEDGGASQWLEDKMDELLSYMD